MPAPYTNYPGVYYRNPGRLDSDPPSLPSTPSIDKPQAMLPGTGSLQFCIERKPNTLTTFKYRTRNAFNDDAQKLQKWLIA